jgi:hypothetical protein
MAYSEALRNISLKADASLAGYTGVPGLPGSADPNYGFQFRFVKVTADRECGLAVGAANEIVIGVVQNKPQVLDQAATVAIRGVSYVHAGGALVAGEAVKVDGTGRGVAAVLPIDAALVVGIVITGAASGQIASVLLKV